MMIRIRNFTKRVNPFWMIILASCFNLLIMHYYILLTCNIDAVIDITTYIDNILGVSFDIFVLLLVLKLVAWNHIKLILRLLFSLTWGWSFSNILYSRFFHHYLSFSAIGQGGSLLEGLVFRSIIEKVYIEDFLFFLYFLLVLFLIERINFKGIRYIKSVFGCFIAVIVIDLAGYVLYCTSKPQLRYANYFLHRLNSNHFEISTCSSQPIFSNFSRGAVRSIGVEVYADLQGSMDITDEMMKTINHTIEMSQKERGNIIDVRSQCNVIFILVESLMSFPIDMRVGSHEVTPFLNSLKHDSMVYYNGKMKKNITIGESSDGQFIYMTGILPLRSMITVSKAKHRSMPGLPKLLGVDSRMVIPTVSSMWNQDDMCQQYGFDHIYTSNDYDGGSYACLNDEQVFQLAIEKDKVSCQPFFSVILTISMHQPYNEQIDSSFPVYDSSMSSELANYLNACHYTDRQIEKYFEYLKKSGLYSNSMIVIAADHPVYNTAFGDVKDYIPFFILNAGANPRNMWQGDCNQLDVYSTLLDLLGIESNWYGLGHSLVSPNYKESVSSKTWEVSEWIVLGDYFSGKNIGKE